MLANLAILHRTVYYTHAAEVATGAGKLRASESRVQIGSGLSSSCIEPPNEAASQHLLECTSAIKQSRKQVAH